MNLGYPGYPCPYCPQAGIGRPLFYPPLQTENFSWVEGIGEAPSQNTYRAPVDARMMEQIEDAVRNLNIDIQSLASSGAVVPRNQGPTPSSSAAQAQTPQSSATAQASGARTLNPAAAVYQPSEQEAGSRPSRREVAVARRPAEVQARQELGAALRYDLSYQPAVTAHEARVRYMERQPLWATQRGLWHPSIGGFNTWPVTLPPSRATYVDQPFPRLASNPMPQGTPWRDVPRGQG